MQQVIMLPFVRGLDGQPIVDALLPYLKRIIMDQAELKTALETVSANLTQFSTDVDADLEQLGKAQNEIIVALQNLNQTSPEVDTALANLQAAAGALSGRQQALRAVAQALDDLNVDAPPAA